MSLQGREEARCRKNPPIIREGRRKKEEMDRTRIDRSPLTFNFESVTSVRVCGSTGCMYDQHLRWTDARRLWLPLIQRSICGRTGWIDRLVDLARFISSQIPTYHCHYGVTAFDRPRLAWTLECTNTVGPHGWGDRAPGVPDGAGRRLQALHGRPHVGGAERVEG